MTIAPHLHALNKIVCRLRQELLGGFASHDFGELPSKVLAALAGLIKLDRTGFQNRTLEILICLWQNGKKGLAGRACRLTEKRNAIGVTTEGGNILMHPLERADLIKNG